jgi:toxin CcdB
MAKFDVYRLRQGGTLVVDCQADLLGELNTRLVVPLLPRTDAPLPAARLNPVFSVGDEQMVMVTQFAATVPVAELGEWLTSLRQHDLAVGNALDMLISGF